MHPLNFGSEFLNELKKPDIICDMHDVIITFYERSSDLTVIARLHFLPLTRTSVAHVTDEESYLNDNLIA